MEAPATIDYTLLDLILKVLVRRNPCDIVNGLAQEAGSNFGMLRLQDLIQRIDIVSIAMQFFVLLYSLTIHEAAHAWMSDRRGDYTARYLGRVSFNPIAHIDPIGTVVFPLLMYLSNIPLIGWAKPVPINSVHLRNPHRDQIFISLAGPASNLLAGCAAFILLGLLRMAPQTSQFVIDIAHYRNIFSQHSLMAPIVGILFFTMITNIGLAIFNLIPVPPLDGHWILYALLPPQAAAALEQMASYGFIFILLIFALMYMGILSFLFIPIEWMRLLLT
jgi:Zn-dependent protease